MLQSVINVLYRYPKARLKHFNRFGGYFNYRKMLQGQKLMQHAATHLPPVQSAADGLEVYFLTGKKYLYQTLFCIQSLIKVSQTPFKFILVDDGSFDEQLIKQINTQLPGAGIVSRQMIDQNINKILPKHQYPVLHHKRQVYPHIKKLTDVHTIPGEDWKLVLDSDMMFWNDPLAIVNWLKEPQNPIYMQDCQESYGYSRQLMEQLCKNKIPSLLNVGAIGLKSSAVNWAHLESWTTGLEEKEGSSYYLEQALTAMLLANVEAVVLPADEYIVNPDTNRINSHIGTLHHYVDLSKEGYFKKAWKAI
ncbi:hypothetical protein [Mucilaginibacter sp. OK283]|uniref:hypothetical protein n=1 Tax=Mucilaginibacter sp. OK283 TaxID=1881049 RepID=UPI000B87DE04|nr:hypothetical protein [Mucilaginibacter sp. OK283]